MEPLGELGGKMSDISQVSALYNKLKDVEAKMGLAIRYAETGSEGLQGRRYQIQEMADLVGISRARVNQLYDEKNHHPTLTPLDRFEGGRRYGTALHLAELHTLFETGLRSSGEEGAAIAFQTPKGGGYKTSSTLNASYYCAEQGYRVCAIDLDPQGSLSAQLGMQPDLRVRAEDTLYGWLIEEEGYDLTWESMVFDETKDIEEFGTQGCIYPTRHPLIDVIPATLALDQATLDMTVDLIRSQEDGRKLIRTLFRLNTIVRFLKTRYDIIIIDGTPSFSISGLNIFFGVDTIVCPVATEITDIGATRSFLRMIMELLEQIGDAVETLEKPLPEILFMPTKFNASTPSAKERSKKNLMTIQMAAGQYVLDNVSEQNRAVADCLDKYRSIFEINTGDLGIDSRTLKDARSTYASLYQEVLEKAIFPRWVKGQEFLQGKQKKKRTKKAEA